MLHDATFQKVLDFIETKAWSMDESVLVLIQVARDTKDEVQVLAVHPSAPLAKCSCRHLHEIRACAGRESADGDAVLLNLSLLSGVEENDAPDPWVRYHCDGGDSSVDVEGGLPLVALLDAWSLVTAADLLSKPERRVLIGLSRGREFGHGRGNIGGVAKESSG